MTKKGKNGDKLQYGQTFVRFKFGSLSNSF